MHPVWLSVEVAGAPPQLEMRHGAGRRKLLPRPLETDARRFEGLGVSAGVLAGIAARVETARASPLRSLGRHARHEADMDDPHVAEINEAVAVFAQGTFFLVTQRGRHYGRS